MLVSLLKLLLSVSQAASEERWETMLTPSLDAEQTVTEHSRVTQGSRTKSSCPVEERTRKTAGDGTSTGRTGSAETGQGRSRQLDRLGQAPSLSGLYAGPTKLTALSVPRSDCIRDGGAPGGRLGGPPAPSLRNRKSCRAPLAARAPGTCGSTSLAAVHPSQSD